MNELEIYRFKNVRPRSGEKFNYQMIRCGAVLTSIHTDKECLFCYASINPPSIQLLSPSEIEGLDDIMKIIVIEKN